ncbi:MAG: ATP-binding protein, partial [Bdellovibrionota bacterium]
NYGVHEVVNGKFKVLKSSAFYGANASGKSNLIKALWFIKNFISRGAVKFQTGDRITGFKPFLLDEKTLNEPSFFEIDFLAPNPKSKVENDLIRFQYGFTVDSKKVRSEWLYAYPHGRAQTWFTREDNKFVWKKEFAGKNKSISEKTGENILYLSKAGGQENHPLLKSLFFWIKEKLRFIDMDGQEVSPVFSAKIASENSEAKKFIADLLFKADTGVKDFSIEFKKIEKKDLAEDFISKLDEKDLEEILGKQALDLSLKHIKKDGTLVPLNFRTDESLGTQKLFALAGPWYDCLKNGNILFVDEFGSGMHPLLAKELIKLFNSDLNTNGAQIIFCSHDTHLLHLEVLRRDQVWLVEKNNEGESKYCSLWDYKPRKDESLEKGYLSGRYGGIPYLQELMIKFPNNQDGGVENVKESKAKRSSKIKKTK